MLLKTGSTWWLSLCLSLLAGCLNEAHGQRYSFQYFGQEQGLENLSIRALFQDQNGFLWVGTTNGLFQYDGARFRSHQQEGLPSRNIRAIAQSTDGTLWVSTAGGLALRSRGLFVPVNFGSTTVPPLQNGLASNGKGGVYFSSSAGLYEVTRPSVSSPPAWRRIWPKPSAPPAASTALHVDGRGSLWFGCERTLCRLSGDTVSTIADAPETEDGWQGVVTDPAGTLWVRSRSDVYFRPSGKSRFTPLGESMPAPNGLAPLFVDPNGDLAIPTQIGLFLRRGGTLVRISSVQGLSADPVGCVLWDREGSPWIGEEAHGLLRWIGYGEWESWTSLQGLSTNNVTAITRDTDGALWVGTKFGLNRMDPFRMEWKHLRQRDGLQSDEIRSLAADPHRGLWIGTDGAGLSYLDTATGRITRFGAAQGLLSNQIVSLTMDNWGTLWVPTRKGLYRASPAGVRTRFEPVTLPSAGPLETVYRVCVERPGRIWMATTAGLRLNDGGHWRHFGTHEGLRDDSLVALALDREGGAWVGYAIPHGISRLVPGSSGVRSVTHYDANSRKLHSDDVSFVEADGRGRIWTGTDAGVDVWQEGTWHYFGSADGLVWPDTVFNAFFADSNRSVWIGTESGLSHFSHAIYKPLDPPPVVVTSVRFGDSVMPPEERTSEPAVPFSGKTVEIEWAALTYINPGSVRFRYRMDESAGWISSEGNKVAFPALSPGSYHFEVAASRGGEWSTPASYSFRIYPPWWATAYFRIGMALLAGGIGFAVWRWRVKLLVEQKVRLERAVRERTHEIEEERDLTRQEKALVEAQKAEIERLLGQSRELNRLKDEFLANMSHEIRTPMNGVLGMTALALGTELSGEQREYLQTVQSSARGLLQVLNEILDFSRIEAGRMELERLPFSPEECARQSLKTLASLARAKYLELNLKLDPDLPATVVGDAQRLRQLLLNLVSNAIKFTERGSVTVSLAQDRQDQHGVLLHITVTDTGIGIPREKLAIIFEPFRQADGSTTRKYGGSGLGLAICARLVKLMNGSIWVNSEPGSGSSFHAVISVEKDSHRFTRTARRSQSGVATPQDAGEAYSGDSLNVLLVEDDPVSRLLALRVLEKRGCTVIAAGNGREALELLDECAVELILMDVQMPEVDGLTATRLIREREGSKYRRLPIYIMTANALDGDRERCMDAGADGYLPKPLEPVDLYRVLEAVRSRASLEK